MSYEHAALTRYSQGLAKANPLILGIETSCDETAAAVLRSREVCSMAVHTQIPLHVRFGGVVPEVASRSHCEQIRAVVEAALSEAKAELNDIDGIAVTQGPGLAGALHVGVTYAKALALGLGVPLFGVHHIHGHIAACELTHPELSPPYTCLVASGGHTHLVQVTEDGYALLGRTRDDAAGEALDKVARVLGLPYPGGPHLEALALSGDERAVPMPAAKRLAGTSEFSFSGLKTAAIQAIRAFEQRKEPIRPADVAASFQRAVIEALTSKAVEAALHQGAPALALAGGVAANAALRKAMREAAEAAGLRFYCPSLRFCTDNAAMIAFAGDKKWRRGEMAALDISAQPSWPIA